MDDKLRASLDELQQTINEYQADGEIDDEEREHLRVLVERINNQLGDGPDEDGFVDHLEESAIRFEGRHPTVAAVIRSAVDTATGLGM